LPLILAACQDSTTPDVDLPEVIGRPNIALTGPESYGFVDGFAFLPPLVESPDLTGQTLNPNLRPFIELWLKSDLFIPGLGDTEPYTCAPAESEAVPINTFTPEINLDFTAYTYGWKTSEDFLADSTEYRLCVKIALAGVGGVRAVLVGHRDVFTDKTTNSNNPAGEPYRFQNGSQVPIKLWLSNLLQCTDEEGRVIDCTIATFDSNGGTATCDDAQCGIYVPAGAIPEGELQTFEVRYVQCPDSSAQTGTVKYLSELDIPQYPGCLEITTFASYDWSQGLQDGIIAAACRDVSVLGPRDERLLLHVESASNPDSIYALPTKPFDLDCGPTAVVLDPSASFGERLRHYAGRGARAIQHALLPWTNPPVLEAAHAGFGGGTKLSCQAPPAGLDGPEAVGGECSTPSLASGAGSAAQATTGPGDIVTFKMVWALPSKIAARLQVVPPATTIDWIDPVNTTVGGTLFPAVLVTDECEPDSNGGIIEDCVGDVEAPVEGATVTFTLSDNTTVTDTTGPDGIAWAPWTLTAPGTFMARAGGLGIGVDPSLASVTLSPPPAEGAYQDHIGNLSVLLEEPQVRFNAAVCSQKDFLLNLGVNPADYDGSATIPINLSGSDSDVAFLYWATDCYRTYFAFVVPQAPDFTNTLRMVFVDDLETRFGFDPMNPVQFSAVPEVGDDMWKIYFDTNKKNENTYLTWIVEDWHVADDCTGSSKQSECGKSDLVAGHTDDLVPGDGGAAYVLDDATIYEFAREFPADPADEDSYDFSLPAIGESTWVAFYVVSQRGNGAQADMEWPDFRLFFPIEIVRQ
jgi:hypothetical protein